MELNDFNQMGKIKTMKLTCRKCGKSIEISQVYRTTTCPSCSADLHSCINCNFYSKGSHYDCKETVEENIADKERANFCDFFSFNKDSLSGANISLNSKKADEARASFNALFGN
ncbi:hypothetical protein [Treponema pectinovorum]|uniref:hypothetical protein n=1 Tax=Treponema pectinovorum TaxID=164 RepID=UPI003D8D6DEA